MTLDVTTRAFTVEEARHLASWRPPRFGCAICAAWLLIVPVIIAGIISFTLLLAGVSLGMNLAISYALGLAFGAFGLWRQYRKFQESIGRYAESHKRARERGKMSTLSFTAKRAWHVDGLEGAIGYVLDAGSDQCVYLSGPAVPESDATVFPAGGIAVDVIPEINEIYDLRLSPGSTNIEGAIAVGRLGVAVYDEARLIPLSQVLAAVNSQVSRHVRAEQPGTE